MASQRGDDQHGRPITRRDFLGRGLIAGAAMVTAPNLLGLLGARGAAAQTAACAVGVGGSGMIPFICIDLAGGANLAGSNVMVGGAGGQLDFISDAGYEKLGLPVDMLPQLPGQLDQEFGIAFHADSAFLRGMQTKTSPATRANVNGSVICATSSNDTGNNPHNPMYGIYRAGSSGDLVALIGTETSESGGNSQAPTSMVDPAARPTKVERPSDVTGMVDTGKLVTLLSPTDAGHVMRAVEQISDLKLAKMNEDASLETLLRCSYVESTDKVARFGDPSQLDPRLDPEITGQPTSIFSAAELGNRRFEKTASVMKMVVSGLAGAGTIELGGYDYHDSTRSTGEIFDFLAGQAMGAMLEYAARLGQPLMLYVFSDGSVASDGQIDNSVDGRGKLIWRGDNSSTAAVLMLVYSPNGRPALTRPEAQQLGYFRDNGSVETAATRVSDNVTQLAQAIVLNYMALHGNVGQFATVLPNHGLGGTAADLDALTAFQPIV